MALLVMSGVLIVGASLGTISLLTLRQGRIIDDSIIAFGAAETGAEQSLYQLRRVGATSGLLNASPNHDSGTVISGPAMTNASSWKRMVSSNETTIFTAIPRDKTYELVLWDPENPSAPAGIESLRLAWDDNCGGTSSLEVLAAGWDPGAIGGFNPSLGFHGDSPALTFLRDPVRVIDNDFAANEAYRVRFRAKTCDVFNLAVSGWSADNADSGSGIIVNLPSRVAVTSTGSYGSSRQAMELRLPRLNPLSGVFDFVIFSQCSILKGVAGAC
jgi:hypothetical protein